jgi:Domain of unknown function (DUF4258)
MECSSISFSRHAYLRLAQRRIAPSDVVAVVTNGEVIETYPLDTPRPSYLLLGRPSGLPLHVLVSKDDTSGRCYIVTVYTPDPDAWNETFRKRR